MPNSYHYFESGEVSPERLSLEIEILKQLHEVNLLHNLDWKSYDTTALNLFVQAGIQEANDELTQRYINHSNEFEQIDFINQCIQKSPSIKQNFKQQRTPLTFIFNLIFIVICLFFVIGLFIYEYIKFGHQHHFLQSLEHPLTAKRRHLSFTDDLPMIILTFTNAIILGCTIFATRFSRKMILFGLFALLIIIILLIKKGHQIITFLSKYRELRWPMLYDYIYS